MKTKHILVCLFLFAALFSSAQNENNKWYFGDSAAIDFNTSPPTALFNSGLMSIEGSASISDAAGALLFYTNGEQVFTKSHVMMPNGFGLMGFFSNAQPATIIQKPGSPNLYYIFGSSGVSIFRKGFYSIVDMNENGGEGDVILKNVPLADNVTEAMVAIPHADKDKFWIIYNVIDTAQFQAYLFDCHGVDTVPVISNAGIPISFGLMVANLCVSPNNKKIISTATYFEKVCILDFNNATGVISDNTFLNLEWAYGCCFSPNSNVAYINHAVLDNTVFPIVATNTMLQYDLSSNDSAIINASKLVLDTIVSITNGEFGQIQRAPNNKLYTAWFGASVLPTINNPDVVGTGCNYVRNGFSIFPEVATLGLPAIAYVTDTIFTPDFLGNDTLACGAITLNAAGAAPFLWSTGDTTSTINVASSGQFWVNTKYCDISFTDTITVSVDPPFTFEIAADRKDCDVSALLTPSVTGDSYIWSTSETTSSITATANGTYTLQIQRGNCKSTASVALDFNPSVESLHLPNVFTPNTDNINDIIQFQDDCYTLTSSTIYNRWGEVVQKTTAKNIIWDGKTKGQYAADGVYFYLLEIRDKNQKAYTLKGCITVL